MKDLPRNRPAEVTAFAASLAVLIGYFAGISDPAVLAALTVVVGAIPGVVTSIVVQLRDRKKAPA